MKPYHLTQGRKLGIVLVGLILWGVGEGLLGLAAYAQTPGYPSKPTVKDPKLSSLLRALRDEIPQENQPLSQAQQLELPRGFSVEKLSKPIVDAVQAQRMRITPNAEVQVYIELSKLTDENLQALRGLGVKVQVTGEPVPNKAKGEVLTAVPTVQALLPAAMIAQTEEFPFVRYIRLPDYPMFSSSTGTGLDPIDSQGDSILQANTARSTYNVTGAGVRVGVISDGIGGIFPTGCTTCPLTPNTPPSASIPTPNPILLGDLPGATGTRNANGTLVASSGGIIAQSFRSDGDLEYCGTPCDTTSGKAAEGTAMLEIVYDLAPQAQLYFANEGTSLEMEQAEDYLAANTEIVVTDISYFTPPFDGTSPVSTNTSDVLNNNANPIRGLFVAVGNFAQDHYQGLYVDSETAGESITGEPGDLHLFTGVLPGPQPKPATIDNENFGSVPFDPIVVVPGNAEVEVYLAWNDPTGGSLNDYDLFLVPLSCNGVSNNLPLPPCTISGSSVASSTNPQTGTQDPTESVAWTNPNSTPAYLGIVIQNVQNMAMPKMFDMFVHGYMDKESSPNHNFNTAGGSIPAVSDATGLPVAVVGVGAIDQSQCPSPDNCTGFVELFSGQGSTEMTPQQATGTMKPDLIAVDNVCVTGAGGFGNGPASDCPPIQPTSYTPQRFGGTSAAAPHAAAVAALALQSAPCLLYGATNPVVASTARTNLRTALVGQAVALPGVPEAIPNNVEGDGLVNALASVKSMVPTATAGVSQTVNATSASGATVVLNVADTDPNNCPLTAVQWTGSCGSGSATGVGTQTTTGSGATAITTNSLHVTLSCPVGVNTVQANVSNNGLSFSQPDISPYTVIVTDFGLSASPASASAVAGAPVLYTVNVVSSAQGAFTNPVSLACSAGLPPGATCLFSPANVSPATISSSGTVTPVAASSTLTIYTSGSAMIHPKAPWNWPPLKSPTLWFSLAIFLVVLAIWMKTFKRKLGFRFTMGALLVLVAASPLSCGGSSRSSSAPQTYTVTITGTSNQLQHPTTVSLTVQ
jgi:hypothetical protein